jgi:multiple RNA-binding domain-containing protein 1
MEVMQPKTNSWVDDVDPLLSSPEKNNAPAAQKRLKDISEEAQQDLTDLEWMRQRMTGGVGDANSQDNVFEQSGSEEEDQRASEEKDPTEETILRTARLFVRNLTFTCTEEELRGLFQPFGTVSQVRGIYLSKLIESSGWWGEMWLLIVPVLGPSPNVVFSIGMPFSLTFPP